MAHDVFLSYSRKDTDTMQRLRDGLRGAGVKVWTDDNLKVGTPAWEAAIQEAIETAHFIVVLLSPDSKSSKWVGREIAYAENFKITILPILISEKEKESIPIRLVDYQYASLVGANFEQFVKELADVIIPPAPAPPPTRPTGDRLPPSVSAPLVQRSASPPPVQAPFGAGGSNLRFGQASYQDFLQRHRFDSAAWEQRLKKERAEAHAKIEKIRAGLPDAPTVRPWHPVDQLRLLRWLVADPDQAYLIQYKMPLAQRARAGAWLLSLIAYLPLLIVSLAAALGWLPLDDDLLGLPRGILLIAILVCWALTGFFADFTDDSDFILAQAGGVVGLFLIAPLIGGWPFLAAGLAVALLLLMALRLIGSVEEPRAVLLLIIGSGLLGITGQMAHLDLLEQTLPLVDVGLSAGLLLLAAIVTVGGLWGAVALSPVFDYMLGENSDDDPRSTIDALTSNGATTWLLGLGLALIICLTLTIGLTVAVETNADVTGWLADHLPHQITGVSPNVDVTLIGVNVAFSLADVTHGLIAGWTAFLVALVAGSLLVIAGLVPAFIGDQAFNGDVQNRRMSLFGLSSAALYLAACVILLIVPPLTA